MGEWFQVRRVADDVWSIVEPGHVNLWLIVGSERALLIDSGLGIAPLRPVVEQLTDRPVLVVNTHHHFDHVGGNAEFGAVAAHPAGIRSLVITQPRWVREAYLAYTADLLRAADKVTVHDRRYLHLLDADSRPRPLPVGLNADSWAPAAARRDAIDPLADGQSIDLGARVVRVLHTPGHTADSICIFDEHTRILFAGDTINVGPIYAQFEESDVARFLQTTDLLASMERDISFVAVAHFGRTIAPPTILTEVRDALRAISDRRTVPIESADCLGDTVSEHCFSHLSVLTPAVQARSL